MFTFAGARRLFIEFSGARKIAITAITGLFVTAKSILA